MKTEKVNVLACCDVTAIIEGGKVVRMDIDLSEFNDLASYQDHNPSEKALGAMEEVGHLAVSVVVKFGPKIEATVSAKA